MQQERNIPQTSERKLRTDAASIASHVAQIVDNLQRDSQTIQNPYELCNRADMAIVAMFEIVAPVLPEIVRAQAERLISIHDVFYHAALSTKE